jgi:cytochrome P450
MAAPSQPPLVPVSLASPAFKQDPLPTLSRLRETGPLVRVRVPIFGKVWIATTYDAVSELLRDHHRFVQNPAHAGNRTMGLILRWLPRSLRPLTTQMLIRDEPDHRRLRSLVDQAFQRQSVEALRPRIETITDELLDRCQTPAASAADGIDLLGQFCRPLPLAVICELLGLPPEDRPSFTRWAAGFSTASSLWGIVWGLRGLRKLLDYLREEIKRQTVHPRDGLLAALIQAEDSGDRLSEDELLAMVFLLLAAGHETTLHQIAGSVLALLDHPNERLELTADWTLAETAVQELLRYVSFAQLTKPRYARDATEFCGHAVGRGQMLFACLATANFDPQRFASPERLDLRRQPNRHVAFGMGIHYCLGAKLASVETEIALRRLFTRFPQVRLAIARPEVRYLPRLGTRGLVALPVHLA